MCPTLRTSSTNLPHPRSPVYHEDPKVHGLRSLRRSHSICSIILYPPSRLVIFSVSPSIFSVYRNNGALHGLTGTSTQIGTRWGQEYIGDDVEMSLYCHFPYHTPGSPRIKFSFLANRPQHHPSLHQRSGRTHHLAQRLLDSLPLRRNVFWCG